MSKQRDSGTQPISDVVATGAGHLPGGLQSPAVPPATNGRITH